MDHVDELRKLKKGERLPCGCEVLDTPWTREYAKTKVYGALAERLSKDSQDIPEETTFASLGLTQKQLRELWGDFFVACDVDFKRDKDGNLEYLCDDSKLPPIPPAIREFIDEVQNLHSGLSYKECLSHWAPL